MAENNKDFPKGIIFKLPSAKAPDYVKGRIAFKVEEAIQWLKDQGTEWVNVDLKISKDGNPYTSLNTWKRGEGNENHDANYANETTPPPTDEDDVF